MNIKQQQILARQTIEQDLLNNNGHKPVSNSSARIAKSATILKSTLTQDETDQLNSDLDSKSPRQQETILSAWYDYKESANVYNAAKVRVMALTAWDGSTIWINKQKNSQNVFLWKDSFDNVILQWQRVDDNGLVRKSEMVRVGWLDRMSATWQWIFACPKQNYENWVRRINNTGAAQSRQKLQGGFLPSESQHNYGKRRYQ